MAWNCSGIMTDAAVRLMPGVVWLLALLLALPACAQGVRVPVCYNYGCNAHDDVSFGDTQLEHMRARLHEAHDPSAERAVLAAVIGNLYAIAGRQTPIGADRAGNYLDHAAEGRMDCIDHSTTTTRFLELLEARGMLRYHRVLTPARRSRIVVQHFSAVIEEIEPPAGLQPEPEVPDHVPMLLVLCDCAGVLTDIPRPEPMAMSDSRPGERYAIDSWFVDNGEAAIVLPLANWLDGEGPNVQ